jgi:hypothetical protein
MDYIYFVGTSVLVARLLALAIWRRGAAALWHRHRDFFDWVTATFGDAARARP